MYSLLEARLARVINAGAASLFSGGNIGLEKESLRVSNEGCISGKEHPKTLGSALTNRYITTDYSEALTEIITPPFNSSKDALGFLGDAHAFVYSNLNEEILWSTSMPCVLAGGANIPVAQYGSSNAGLMKTAYRRGLGHRYGRVMQVISGVHFNYSLPDAFWRVFQELEQNTEQLRGFRDKYYLGMLRNLKRYGWLVPYLFGASPAVCKSFIGDKETRLEQFNDNTYFEPLATSLRMGDIGYTNSREKGVGIDVCYDSLDSYINSLDLAINTSCAEWERYGTLVNGRYEQLNTNILQIENEHYSTVRPKQIAGSLEKPSLALQKRGIRYVELRSIDVNALHPLGVSQEQLWFLEAFMIFCLLHDSPGINVDEQKVIYRNLELVAHRGRDERIGLLRRNEEIKLRDWANELCSSMLGICEQLDGDDPGRPYSSVLKQQLEVVADPTRTPSAMMLAEMQKNGEGFFSFAQRMSLQHKQFFDDWNLSRQRQQLFEEEAKNSLESQAAMEDAGKISFEQFLQEYFRQT
ncbi:MAG: glutamate--cysteine ligase [Gammaproteobacteria bacterium]|nr:glutamate--cysteine ligase [Gammaproteobacteria bacterium]